MTESAVHLAIQHVLPRNSARPKGSALFYKKLNPDISLLVSGLEEEMLSLKVNNQICHVALTSSLLTTLKDDLSILKLFHLNL